MRPTELIPAGPLTSERPQVRASPLLRDLLLVAMAGIAAAWLGQWLGRHVRVGLGMPLAGSVAVTLPRVLLLLAVLCRVNRAGVLTGAAVSEILARAAMGMGGLLPTGLAAPLVAGAVADAVWGRTKGWRSARGRLALTGAVLAGTRVAMAWAMMAWPAPLPGGMSKPAAAVCAAVVAVDVLLGAAAGILASPTVRAGRQGE